MNNEEEDLSLRGDPEGASLSSNEEDLLPEIDWSKLESTLTSK